MFLKSVVQFLGILIPNLLFNVLFQIESGSPGQGGLVCSCGRFPANSRLRLQNRAKKLRLTHEAENENQRRNVRDEGARTARADANHVYGQRKNDRAEGETDGLCFDRRDACLPVNQPAEEAAWSPQTCTSHINHL